MHVQPTHTASYGPEVTDETLAKEFQVGDREAFGVLYARYADQVAGYVRRRRPNAPQADCEDLVQEVFAEALGEIGTWRDSGQDSSFRRWLFACVAHFVLHKNGKAYWVDRQVQFRSEDRLRRELRDNPPQAVHDPLAAVELSQAAGAKLASLRPRYRQVIELRYVEGLSIDQTAEAMGCTPGSVRWLVAAALDELRYPKTVKHDSADTTARILNAACGVLAECGERDLTLRLVASRAGVSQGLVSHRFGGRAGLLAAVRAYQDGAPVELHPRSRGSGGPRSLVVRCGSVPSDLAGV